MSESKNGHYKVIGTRPIRHDGVDKVTGRAKYGADYAFPGMLFGKVLRSPHAHAIIKSINVDKALKMPGVRAIVTSADLPEAEDKVEQVGEAAMNPRYLSMNILAHQKALYDGHAIAAVAATSPHIAEEALRLIEVDYEVLPPVMTVDDAMKKNAPILLPNLRNKEEGDNPTNVASHLQFKRGDVGCGTQGRRLCGRARVPHRDGASRIHRAAQRGRHLQLRRPRDDLLLDPGRVRRPLDERAGARSIGRQDQSRSGRDWRRLRRQDHHLSRTALADAGEEDRSSGETGDDARRSAARERPDLGLEDQDQDGMHARRKNHRRGSLVGLRSGRVPGLAGGRRRDVPPRALQHRQFPD